MVVDLLAGTILSVLGGDVSQVGKSLFNDRRFRNRVVEDLMSSEIAFNEVERQAVEVLLRDTDFWTYITNPGLAKRTSDGGLKYRLEVAGLNDESATVEKLRTALRRSITTAILEFGSLEQRFAVAETIEQTDSLHYLIALVTEMKERLSIDLLDRVKEYEIFGFEDWNSLTGCTVIGRYVLEKLIGQGGSGAAFLALDLVNQDSCCVKLLRPIVSGRREQIQGVLDNSVAGLHQVVHRNIVPVVDKGVMGHDQVVPFTVSPYIEGKNLESWAITANLRRRLAVIRQVAEAIGVAHEASYISVSGIEQVGLLHGDLTPSNIIIDDCNIPHVIDFLNPDLQKLTTKSNERPDRFKLSESERPPVHFSEMYGTPNFMSPEQEKTGVLRRTGDIFTLGVTTSHICITRDQLASNDRLALIELMKLIDSMTCPEPERRPSTMAAVADRIDSILAIAPAPEPP